MTKEEYDALKWMLNRIELGGNDGADIAEYQDYCRMLEHKYNLDINQLEANYINSLSK